MGFIDASVVVAVIAAVASLATTVVTIVSRRKSDWATAEASYAQAQKSLADAQESLQQQLMDERVRVGRLHETMTVIEDQLAQEKRRARLALEEQDEAVAYIRAIGHWVGELCPRLDLTGMPDKPHLPEGIRHRVEATAARNGLLTGVEKTLRPVKQDDVKTTPGTGGLPLKGKQMKGGPA